MAKKEKTTEQIEKEKELKIFWTRVIIWSLFACVIPVLFIGYRYDLFKKVGSLQLSGWGLIAVIIILIFAYAVIKYLKAGFNEWSMTQQIINGIIKVILPLVTAIVITINIKNNLDAFIQSLSCVLISEVIAIPLNPFPEWIWKKTQGKLDSTIDFVVEKLYNKTSGTKKKKGE